MSGACRNRPTKSLIQRFPGCINGRLSACLCPVEKVTPLNPNNRSSAKSNLRPTPLLCSPSVEPYQIVIEGTRQSCSDFIAIDDLRFEGLACPELGDNDFEKGYLDYENTGSIHWQLGKGIFKRSHTPATDHTYGTQFGMLYLASSLG